MYKIYYFTVINIKSVLCGYISCCVSVLNSLVIGWEQEEAGPVSEEVPDWSGGLHGMMLVNSECSLMFLL